MTFKSYVSHLQGTIESYPSKVNKHLQKLFVDKNVAQAQSQMRIDAENSIDVVDLELEEQIKKCLEESIQAVKLFEEWEFEKDYKYSTLFESDDFDSVIETVRSIAEIIPTTECENEKLTDGFSLPIRFELDNLIFIKFCLKFSAIDNVTREEVLIKYPVLIVFHFAEKIIEFRFDVLKRIFLSDKKEQSIYSDLINDLKQFCQIYLKTQLTPIDLFFMKEETESQDNVRLMAQYMRLARGGIAQLEVGNNEDYVLPIIGDLKELLQKNIIELEKVPVLKEALNQFIFENDELSDYTWIEVMWENEIKTRSIRVKFVYGYRDNDYCLMQHYYNHVLVGMERMDHVIRYIAEHRHSGNAESVVE